MYRKVDWDIFAFKFRENPHKAFEELAYHVFCRTFGMNEGLQADYNHPHLESEPARLADGTVVGFQAKYYKTPSVNSAHQNGLIKAIKGAKEEYPEINKIYFYLDRPFSHSMSQKIEEEAKKLQIEVIWIVPSKFEIILNEDGMKDLWEYNFTLPPQITMTDKGEDSTGSIKIEDLSITTEDFDKYYKDQKNDRLNWIEKDGMPYRDDYLPLCGIINTSEDEEGSSAFVDLLNLVLNPSKSFMESNAGATQFIAIYGPSRSGLTFLCETALQSFIKNRTISEFDNIAYFSINEEDIEETVLYERLKIEGKSIFSEDFNNGLLIIDGLGRMFDKNGYNLAMVSALKKSIDALKRNDFILRVVITVRVSIEYDSIAQWPNEEDMIYIQNRMINLNDINMLQDLFEGFRGVRLSSGNNKKQFEKLLLDIYNSPEYKAVLIHPEWFKDFKRSPQTILGSIRNNAIYTKYSIIYNILHNRLIGADSWEEVDSQCVNIASAIYAKEEWKYLEVNNTEEYARIPFLAIEGCKIGFRSSAVLDYYIAEYLYGLFTSISSRRPKSIVKFLAALSKVELVDGEYNTDIQNIGIHADVSTNHELVIYFFKDRCEDEPGLMNRRCAKAVFSYLVEGRINDDYLAADMVDAGNERDFAVFHDVKLVSAHSIIERVVRNLVKLLRVFLKLDTDNMVAFKDFISMYSFNSIKLPDTINAEHGLEHANFKQSVFEDFKIGIDDNSEDKTEVLHSDFGESYMHHLSIHNSEVEFCDFSNVSIDTVKAHGSIFRHCSFENAEMPNACFEESQFYHTSFNGLKIDTSAFDDFSFIDGKSVKEMSDEEWKEIGVKPVDEQISVETDYS